MPDDKYKPEWTQDRVSKTSTGREIEDQDPESILRKRNREKWQVPIPNTKMLDFVFKPYVAGFKR